MTGPTAKNFKDELLEEVEDYLKSSWDKDELILFISAVYANLLEKYLD